MERNSEINLGGWRSAIFIIFVEMAERFAYYGVAGNMMSYLTKELNQSTASAAINVNVWIGVSAIFPILGGILADSYLGRFKTIFISSLVYFIGLVLLTTTETTVPQDHKQAVFFLSIYILAIGEGGHKPSVQTFAADQFDDELPEEKEAKTSFFNWWYSGIVCGSTSALLVIFYVQEYMSWGVSFGILATVVAIALFIFMIGSSKYRRQQTIRSPFARVAQVFVAAFNKRNLPHQGLPATQLSYYQDLDHTDQLYKLPRTTQFRFLDKATIIDEIDASNQKHDNWRLCSTNQVQEVKLVLNLIPIWVFSWMFPVVTSQQSTFFTKQGSTLTKISITKSHQVPPASMQVITGLTILFGVLFYDKIIVPFAKKISRHPSGITVLQRIGAGLFLSIITMVVAALVETKRLSIARQHGLLDEPKSTIPMTICWLIPQYILMGITDVFAYVGLQELFYFQMPEGLRSMGAAACVSVVGLGNLISGVIISIVKEINKDQKRENNNNKWLGDNLNHAHLNYFYFILAGLSALNLIAYLLVANRFVFKNVQRRRFDAMIKNKDQNHG